MTRTNTRQPIVEWILFGTIIGVLGTILVVFSTGLLHRESELRSLKRVIRSRFEQKKEIDPDLLEDMDSEEISLDACREKLASLTEEIEKRDNGAKKPDKSAKISALPRLSSSNAPCDPGWIYLNLTQACYFYKNFTFADDGTLQTYKWRSAEENCVKIGGHLSSISSVDELRFLQDLVATRDLAEEFQISMNRSNVCHNTDLYAWIGLYKENGERRFVDGTPVKNIDKDVPDHVEYAICNDLAHPASRGLFYLHQKPRNARYICKKPSKTERIA